MQSSGYLFCLVSGLLLLAGCADSPVTELAAYNPWERSQWAEDERFGPTQHQQTIQLASLRKQARQLDEAERAQRANELARQLGQEETSVMRRELVQTLAALRTPAAAGALQMALADPDPDVRVAACEAWGNLGGPQAIQLLAQTLGSDTDLDVRLAATRQLGRFSDQTAVQALGLALDDPDPALQYRAVQSLKRSSGQNFGDSVPAWQEFVRGGTPPTYQPSLAERWRNWF